MKQYTITISDRWEQAAQFYGTTPESQINGLERDTVSNATAAQFKTSVFDGLQKIPQAKAAQIQNDLILTVKTEVDKLPK